MMNIENDQVTFLFALYIPWPGIYEMTIDLQGQFLTDDFCLNFCCQILMLHSIFLFKYILE